MKKYINPYNLFVGSFIPNWLLRRDEVSPGAKLCYARLGQFAGKNGDCFPSQVVLGKEIGAGERQIRRYLSELEKYALIDSVQVGLNKSNRYRFLWHHWMELNQGKWSTERSRNSGEKKSRPDRTNLTTPDRTDLSPQERPHRSCKENPIRNSFKETTTEAKDVVVKEQIEEIKRTLSPVFADIPDTVLACLIEKKGIDHVLSIANQTAYQINHKSIPPENPSGYFVALTMTGMNRPHGYISPQEAKSEKLRGMKPTCSRSGSGQEMENPITTEEIKAFVKNLGAREKGGTKSSNTGANFVLFS